MNEIHKYAFKLIRYRSTAVFQGKHAGFGGDSRPKLLIILLAFLGRKREVKRSPYAPDMTKIVEVCREIINFSCFFV
jgi:hypothetical protein